MLAVTEPGVRKLTAVVATQLLKSTLIENIVGFHMDLDPCPMLIVQPKDSAALQFSKERIAPFIKATPALRGLISSKTRNAGDTVDYKAFPGGFLGIVGGIYPGCGAHQLAQRQKIDGDFGLSGRKRRH